MNGSLSLMKRYILALMLAIACSLAFSAVASAKEEIRVVVDTQPVPFSIHPYLDRGTTLVQLRPLFESLGIELDWNAATKTVSGRKGDERVQLTIGQSTATVNGQSVSLAGPGQIRDGHTLVPLRFIGEATGASVGWHAPSQTIQVYSSEYRLILGLSKEEAGQAVLLAPPAQAAGGHKLQGFYARGSADLMGTRGCRGMCWDYFYFFNNQQVIKDPPPLTGAKVDCEEHTCLSYELKGDQLIIAGDRTYTIGFREQGITLNSNLFVRHDPLLRPRLEGTYVASGYTGGTAGGGFATTSTLVFRPDGTFLDDRFLGVITDGSPSGDGTGIDSTHLTESESAGRYTVINHTILLQYEDGPTEKLLFFRPDGNDRMYKIGGRDFLYTERTVPDRDPTASEPSANQVTAPFADRLLTEGYASKNVFKQHNPRTSKTRNDVDVQVSGYQWADLSIAPEHQSLFTGFGDGPIVALTVKYNVTNKSTETIDLTSLKVTVDVADGVVTETPALAPAAAERLSAGEQTERLAVLLFPADMLKKYSRFDLGFIGLKTAAGAEAWSGGSLSFRLNAPYS
ncbi:copper amine oxidase N-terminal domain-containing protein [Paenibacillus daejeonensis]|uniref:copper amine oxidase N-terminal domain-containing protein n=1 Tax=Paenibacillus daejeonensis TaxID=135193 RepID=UPI0003735CDB|nr:copper amine oxidase N-terminal domain-containing protein [Paenibacillus daejeonensis]